MQPYLFDRVREAFARDGLQQVVDRGHLEGSDRVPVGRSAEDDAGRDGQVSDRLSHGHAVQSWHGDVQKHQIG